MSDARSPDSEDERPQRAPKHAMSSMAQLAEAAAVAEELERRKKRLKVNRACVRCKQAKTCCDDQRPCRRCIRLGCESECVDAEQRKPGRKKKNIDDGSLSDNGGDTNASPPPPPPFQTPTTPQFMAPAPKPPNSFSTSSIPRIVDTGFESAMPPPPPHSFGAPAPLSIDRKHPLYITPDTLPNPEKSSLAYLQSALSIAYRAGEQFTQSILPPTQAVGSHMMDSSLLDLAEHAAAEAAKARAGIGSGLAAMGGSFIAAAAASIGGPVSRLLAPTTVMQSAYFALFECLRSLRRAFEAGQTPMHEPLHRFLCLHLLNKAPAYGIPAEMAAQHRRELGVDGGEHLRLVPNSEWLRAMTAAAGRAPIGVIGVQFTDTCIDTIFVNDEAGRLFGYTPSEIKRLILDPRENFFLRVWHFDDWRRMFTMTFSALVQQVEHTATKGRFFHSSGTRFEAVWSVQFTFTPEGMPTSEVIYITPTDQPLHNVMLPAAAAAAASSLGMGPAMGPLRITSGGTPSTATATSVLSMSPAHTPATAAAASSSLLHATTIHGTSIYGSGGSHYSHSSGGSHGSHSSGGSGYEAHSPLYVSTL